MEAGRHRSGTQGRAASSEESHLVTMPGDHPPPPGTSGQALTPGLRSDLLAHLCLKTQIKISGHTGDTQRLHITDREFILPGMFNHLE